MEQSGNPTAQKLLESFVRFRRAGWRHNPVADLTPSEMMVMFLIGHAVAGGGSGLRVSDLSAHLNVAPPTITEQINSLETHGFVRRTIDKEDRRAVRLALTEEGHLILRKASDNFLASISGLVEYLGEDESNRLADLLGQVFTYFDEVRSRSQAILPNGDNR